MFLRLIRPRCLMSTKICQVYGRYNIKMHQCVQIKKENKRTKKSAETCKISCLFQCQKWHKSRKGWVSKGLKLNYEYMPFAYYVKVLDMLKITVITVILWLN